LAVCKKLVHYGDEGAHQSTAAQRLQEKNMGNPAHETEGLDGLSSSVAPFGMKLEVVVIPVADVDRAKEFYQRLGWRLDADFAASDDYRVIQFTPPGSGCSVIFGKNVTAAEPGSAQGLYLIVSDLEAARSELLRRGVEIGAAFHDAGDVHAGPDEPYLFGRLRVGGSDPEHRSNRSFASFYDPDGNGWLLRRGGDDLRLARRSGKRPASRRRGSWTTRSAHGAPRCQLARLVRPLHGARTNRRRVAAVSAARAIERSCRAD
jgi:catechol 2,3-dioxygenase-like lactoylglutathione lyase family enzyme